MKAKKMKAKKCNCNCNCDKVITGIDLQNGAVNNESRNPENITHMVVESPEFEKIKKKYFKNGIVMEREILRKKFLSLIGDNSKIKEVVLLAIPFGCTQEQADALRQGAEIASGKPVILVSMDKPEENKGGITEERPDYSPSAQQ